MTAGSSLRQQVDGWAEHVAAIRSGNLQLSRQLSGLEAFSRAELSPRLDYLAAVPHGRNTVALVLVPATGAQVNLQQLMEAEGRDLEVPGTRPLKARVEDVRCAHLQQRHRCTGSVHASAGAGRHGAVW